MERTFDRALVRKRLGRFRGNLVSNRWAARLLQMIVGLWILCSAFLWHHSGPQRLVAIVGGLLIIGATAIASLFPTWRALIGLVVLWTFIATLTIPANVPTVVSNLYSLVVVAGLCMLPYSEEALWSRYGEERRFA